MNGWIDGRRDVRRKNWKRGEETERKREGEKEREMKWQSSFMAIEGTWQNHEDANENL